MFLGILTGHASVHGGLTTPPAEGGGRSRRPTPLADDNLVSIVYQPRRVLQSPDTGPTVHAPLGFGGGTKPTPPASGS